MNNPFSKTDIILVMLVVILVVLGLTAVYSATYGDSGEATAYFTKQLSFGIVGFVIMLTLAFLLNSRYNNQ